MTSSNNDRRLHPLEIVMMDRGLNVADVVALTRISQTTIYRILMCNKHEKVSWETARAIAHGLSLEVHTLFGIIDHFELTDEGGKPMTGGHSVRKQIIKGELCPQCFMELPVAASGICPDHGPVDK